MGRDKFSILGDVNLFEFNEVSTIVGVNFWVRVVMQLDFNYKEAYSLTIVDFGYGNWVYIRMWFAFISTSVFF